MAAGHGDLYFMFLAPLLPHPISEVFWVRYCNLLMGLALITCNKTFDLAVVTQCEQTTELIQ